jgi:hypothetical protein
MLATLVTRVRDATPAGTAAVFARALEPLTPLWQAVGPGELIVTDAVMPTAIAVALTRPESVTLVFARGHDAALAELAGPAAARARVIVLVVDGAPVDDERARAAGTRVVRPPSLPALFAAVGGALDIAAPTVVVVPAAG